jgi:hypothetical protein
MNLMHLHKVSLPKILSLSISIHTANPSSPTPKHRFSKTSLKPSRSGVTDRAASVPGQSRSSYKNDSRRLKRKSSTADLNQRPKKAPRTDETAADADEFPSLKPVESLLDQLKDPPLRSMVNPTDAEKYSDKLPSVDDDNDSSDNDEAPSDTEESLFGDNEFMQKIRAGNDVTVCQVFSFTFHHVSKSIRRWSARNLCTRFPKLRDLDAL